VDYEGKYYQLKGAISQPKPLQKPHIPFWIAGGGEQLTLNIAARYAQYTNFGNGLDEFKHKSDVLKGHCSDVGTDYSAISRSSNFNIFCAATESEVDEKIQWHQAQQAQHASPERAARFAETYRPFSGTPERILENLKEWKAAGLGYAIINFADVAYDTTGLELFAEQVIPEFQA
jgi:alkanesulfonate monooxygenase SsuD/methylene tetrahydromethanopterin reductase-like flavin-dependent oxidoreductase (luciferase family)